MALAVLTPLLMILCYGPLPSISKYWETEWQPLFILSNAVTSYFFFTLPKWKLPAVFLMLLTAFSVQEYQYIHNLFAIAFFLSSYWVLWYSKRYPVFLLQYGVGIIVMPFSFLWGEVISISALSLYHLTVLIRLQQLINR